MRQYVIDELTPLEQDNLDSYLKRSIKPGPMPGIYWLVVPPDLLSEAQLGHDTCGPFYFAVVFEKDRLSFELLVRSNSNLHCTCIDYATPAQRQFVIDFIDRMLAEEHIRA